MIRRLHRILSPADIASLANASCGFLALLASLESPTAAARLLLLAAIADGIDGILARRFGSSPLGAYLDGLSDVVSFGVAPAVLVVVVATQNGTLTALDPQTLLPVAAALLYLSLALVRLGLYTAEDADDQYTTGVPTTLAATFLAISVLGGVVGPTSLAVVTGVFAVLMITDVRYPDLRARDALVMGGLQALVVISPTLLNNLVLWLLAGFATAYLCLGPRLYRSSASPSV